ncbi:MAG: dockerin type I domain-containing protein, partial [Acutalibacteraceae bacterium]
SSLSFVFSAVAVSENTNIKYDFANDLAGYAEGTVTLSTQEGGSYYLYFADDKENLQGYFPITVLTSSANGEASFNFGEHTAIPADATKVIAMKTTSPDSTLKTAPKNVKVSEASAVYDIPNNKVFPKKSSEADYTFGAYSDIHIDQQYYGSDPPYGFYQYAAQHWGDALDYSTKQGQDFIITAGDNVTNAVGASNEFKVFKQIFADSDFNGYLWEASGNHEIKTGGVTACLKDFSKMSGLDSTAESVNEGKGYYYEVEKTTGDVFIFMALETSSSPNDHDEFSVEQEEWFQGLMDKYYGTGVNIYVIQHALIGGWGAGDDEDDPYYKGPLSTHYPSTVWFKSMMQKYKDLIWFSGHTHENFNMDYNYSNANGTACNMVHIPSCAGPTNPSSTDHSLSYTFWEDESQGYSSQVFGDQIIISGANLVHEMIYPAYSYIMTGSKNSTPESTYATEELTTTPVATETQPVESDSTRNIYFSNKNGWAKDEICYYYWNSTSNPLKWPGILATYVGKDANGYGLYKAVVPKTMSGLIFNNGNNGLQTADITINSLYNWYVPSGTSSKCSVIPKKLDESTIVSSAAASPFAVGSSFGSIDEAVIKAKTVLSANRDYCSYNQYQDLKTLIAKYDGAVLSDNKEASAILEVETAVSALEKIAGEISDSGSIEDVTIYAVIPDEWVEAGYTIKANINTESAGTWVSGKMFDTGKTYNSKKIYSYTFSGSLFPEGGVYDLQIQGYDGSTWMGQYRIYESNFTSVDIFRNKMWCGVGVPNKDSVTAGSWSAFTYDKYVPQEGTYGLLGDVNIDGNVNVKDSSLIMHFSVDSVTFNSTEIILADVNGDNIVNVRDATAIQKYIVKIPISYAVAKPVYKTSDDPTNETTTPATTESTSKEKTATIYFATPSSCQGDNYTFKCNIKSKNADSTGSYYPHSASGMSDTGYTYKGNKIVAVTYPETYIDEYDGTLGGLSKIQLQVYKDGAFFGQFAVETSMTLSGLDGKMFVSTTASPSGTVSASYSNFVAFSHD